MIEASQKAIFDSDDDCKDRESLHQGECSSAQPISSSPYAMRAVRNTREVTGVTSRPLTKKPKGEHGDLNASPFIAGFLQTRLLVAHDIQR
eukprot:5352138-Pyramimonas_sp.AAC.1